MNRDRLAGICLQFKGRVREHWGRFSADPLTAAAGTRERRAGRIREKRGIAKEETERELKDFLARNRDWSDLSRR